jgi:hypothetical protein
MVIASGTISLLFELLAVYWTAWGDVERVLVGSWRVETQGGVGGGG